MQQPEVLARLKAAGVSGLPLTVVDGHVVQERAYPSHEALRDWIQAAVD